MGDDQRKVRGVEGIKVSPNPATAGGTVTVTGEPNGEVFIGYKGEITRTKLDARGKAVVDVPGQGGEEFTVSDGGQPPSNEIIDIASSTK